MFRTRGTVHKLHAFASWNASRFRIAEEERLLVAGWTTRGVHRTKHVNVGIHGNRGMEVGCEGQRSMASCRWDDVSIPCEDSSEMGPHGVSRYLYNRQGIRLATYHWPVIPGDEHADLRGVILLVHGYAVHLTFSFLQSTEMDPPKPYEGSWIHRMNANGYAVWGLDNQSCGRSDGIRSGIRMFFHRFEDLCTDVEQLVHVIKDQKEYRDVPLFMIGESMGGNICMHVSQKLRASNQICGTVLLAPMIMINDIKSKIIGRIFYPVRKFTKKLFRSRRSAKYDVSESANALLRKQFQEDPLNFKGPPRVLVALSTLQQCDRTYRALEHFDFPFLIVQSENDTICDPEGAIRMYQLAKSKKKDLHMLNDPRSFHLLSIEPMHEEVLQVLLDWIQCLPASSLDEA